MKLIAAPFFSRPASRFRIRSSLRTIISRASLWVYGNDVDDLDEFRISLIADTGKAVVWTQTLTGAEVKAACGVSESYFHAKLFLDLGEILLERGLYRVRVEHVEAADPATSWLGWCVDWDRPFGKLSPDPVGDWQDPFYLRFYDLKGNCL